MYFFLNQSWFNALNNEYRCIDKNIVIYSFIGIKKMDFFKIQMASYIYSKYKRKKIQKNKIYI